MNLKDFLDFIDDMKQFDIFVVRDNGDRWNVNFIDEYGMTSPSPGKLFVAGFGFGPTILIHARSFDDAWETWIDELPSIPESELIEAYGIDDSYRTEYKEKDPQPPWHDREAFDAWQKRFKDACVIRLKELGDKTQAGECEYPDLVEGYEHQSNSSGGTGIVNVGNYAWMDEIDPAKIEIERTEKGDE